MADNRMVRVIHCGTCGRVFDTEDEADACKHKGGQPLVGDLLREVADAEERAHGVSPYAPQPQVQRTRSVKDQELIAGALKASASQSRSAFGKNGWLINWGD